jgi:polyamine oxidase
VTVVDQESYRVELPSEEKTKAEMMAVLREMFPDVKVPEPIDFMFPRWSLEPWFSSSYSNWPPSTTLEMHENLRANVDRLWFAGEATNAEFFGFLQGGYFKGQNAGQEIAAVLGKTACDKKTTSDCGQRKHYDVLHGTSPLKQYSPFNGWDYSSFIE